MLLLTPVDPNAVKLQCNGVTAAKAAGVRHIVKFWMIGSADKSPVPLARLHAEAEAFVQASGLAWTHGRPNDLMRYNTQLLMPTVPKNGVIYDSLGDAQISTVAEVDAAEVVARTLIEEGHDRKTYSHRPRPAVVLRCAAALSEAILPTWEMSVCNSQTRCR